MLWKEMHVHEKRRHLLASSTYECLHLWASLMSATLDGEVYSQVGIVNSEFHASNFAYLNVSTNYCPCPFTKISQISCPSVKNREYFKSPLWPLSALPSSSTTYIMLSCCTTFCCPAFNYSAAVQSNILLSSSPTFCHPPIQVLHSNILPSSSRKFCRPSVYSTPIFWSLSFPFSSAYCP